MVSTISLINFRVNEIEFHFNENIQPNTTFQIKPKIECKVARKEDNIFVNMMLKINEDISSPVPFNLKVLLVSSFKLKETGMEVDQKALVNEAFAVMYPYLRSIISTLTLNCNIPAYVLPMVSPEPVSDAEQDRIMAKKVGNLN